jgi:GNAT superfamily N-acetyltransferase
MSIEIDIQTGEASRDAAKPLLIAVWPPDGYAALPNGARRADPDFRILIETVDDGVVCHAGIFRRTGFWKGRKVNIGGVGSLATSPGHRKRGYAGLALRAAVQTFRDEEVVDFGLLFSEADCAGFFETRGWHKFEGGIQTEQDGERARLDALSNSLTPYVFDLRNGPREGVIDIRGLPW